jgi:23S rRNA (uracil1939-C5)-methyltransferase
VATVELQTTGIAKGGEAIAREPSGRVVFVEGALPGERVAVELVDERSDFARGRALHVVDPAEGRVGPPCPHVAEGCGGCDLQHARPATQLTLKAAIVRDALIRIGRVADPPPLPTIALPVAGYRTTVRGLVLDGRFALRRRHSNDPISIASCLILHPLLDELVRDGRFGAAHAVTLRCGVRTGERLAVVAPTAEGVELPGDVLVVGDDELRAGRRAWFHEVVAGQTLRISAQSFFQARPDGAEALVDVVRAEAGPLDAETKVVDAYCGVGLFAATVAREASVVAVERSASSVADARHNLATTRATVVRSELERWRPSRADVVIADPARGGLSALAADRLASTRASRIVLISCDPAAFARDVVRLRERGYALNGSTIVDLFGHTSHIEVVSRFDRGSVPRRDARGTGDHS